VPKPSPAAVAVVAVLAAATAYAAPADVLREYESAARASAPAFAASAERGAQFFRSTHGGDWSCASCHTQKPVVAGQHAKTGKTIAPLSPVANAERFTERARYEKWFRRNCNDVLSRECTPQEKSDVLAFLLSLR
jgi:hypothetical protein